MAKTIVLGCGNVLASDDGVGIKVIRELARLPLAGGVKLVEAGVAGIGILDYFDGQDKAIIIDAILADREPGTIVCFQGGDLPSKNMMPWSLHGMGLLEALQLGYRVEPQRMPKELVIMGIQVKDLDRWKEGLSPEVEAAVPKAVEAVLKELEVTGSA